jgi:hypothetical protein
LILEGAFYVKLGKIADDIHIVVQRGREALRDPG